MEILSISSLKRGIKKAAFALSAIVAIFTPNMASAASCGGRPTEADLRILTDRVKEGIVEARYWSDDDTVPEQPTTMIIGISPVPVAKYGGANIVVIMSETGDASFWNVCGDKFSYTDGEGLTTGDIDHLREGRFGSFFDIEKGARTFEQTIHFETTPNFGPLDQWKEGMLEKVQNALICLLAQHDRKVTGMSALSLHISDFNNRSGGVLVAIPEVDEFWTVGFVLNSSGESDDVVLGNEHELSETKETLRVHLIRDSFVRQAELKCPASGSAPASTTP